MARKTCELSYSSGVGVLLHCQGQSGLKHEKVETSTMVTILLTTFKDTINSR
jgi:hypothetical protein